MQNIQQIIAPVDFHQHTEDLAAFAIDMANKLGAKLTFVHVVENFAQAVSQIEVITPSFTEITEEIFGHAKRKMAELVEQSKASCAGCSGQVLRGDATDGIVDYAGEVKSGLIIIGTHGARGIEKVLLGSVAERVLKRAPCPILIFNPYKGERGYTISPSIKEAVQPV